MTSSLSVALARGAWFRSLAIGAMVLCGVVLLPATARAVSLELNNLALGKPATQSSTLAGTSADASLAVDGNTNPNFWGGSVTHTEFEANPWWEVDLGEVRQIGRIEIFNRQDCCAERLVPFIVIVADIPIIDTDITDDDSSAYPGIMRTRVYANAQAQYRVPINRSGRYVRIALLTPNYLHLAEVQVLEAPDLARGKTTTQSSTWLDGDPSRAVDGNTNPVFEAGSVSATSPDLHAYWEVDLGGVQRLREVHIWTANICCSAHDPRLGYFVWVSAVPITVDPITTFAPGVSGFYVSTPTGSPIQLPVNLPGRYLRIESEGADSVALAEVQVFGVGHGTEGGHANQSSTLPGGEASRAIDASTDQSWGAVTQNQSLPYWEVDLGASRYLETVRLWTLAGQAASLDSYYLFVSDRDFVDGNGQRTTDIPGTLAVPGVSSWVVRGTLTSSTTAVMRRGRFVRVMLDRTSPLCIAEVEIATTEGVVASPRNGTASFARVVPTSSQLLPASGLADQPNVGILAYAFLSSATSGGGASVLLGTAFSEATPVANPYGAGPLYPWTLTYTPGIPYWSQGGVSNLQFESYSGIDGTTSPLRTLNEDDSPSPFWPNSRTMSASPSPDDLTSKPPYLDSPQGAEQTDYYADPFIASVVETKLGFFESDWLQGESRAQSGYYYNRADLGTGRYMSCSAGDRGDGGPSVVACVVRNYSYFDATTPPVFGDEQGSLNAFNNHLSFAAVAMVQYISPSTPSDVMFGVYVNDQRVSGNARLDSVGHNVAIPNNCLACHGGSSQLQYTTTTVNGKTVQHASLPGVSFLPFDPAGFGFSPDNIEGPTSDRFRALNAIVRKANVSPAVADFIDGSYGGQVDVPSAPMNFNYVPRGWLQTPTQQRVYEQVIKPYCRGCHMSQLPTRGGVDFLNAADTEALRALIVADTCVTHRMPHAQQPMKRFWASGARGEILGYYARRDLPGGACGSSPP